MAIIPQEEKVFMVSNSTNTTYSGSAALKAMQQWYTMQDVIDTIKPYKVYTALLSQSGTDAPVATVLENTLGGTPVWSYDSTGYYLLDGVGLFSGDVVINVGNEGSTDFYTLSFSEDYTDDQVNIFTSLLSNIGGGDNGLLDNTSITIKIYN